MAEAEEFHIVRRQRVELRLSSDVGAHALQEEVSRVHRAALVPLMDEVFSSLATGEEVVKLERVDVELGTLSATNLEEELVSRTRARLEEALRGEIGSLREGSAPRPRQEILSTAESSLRVLRMFLETGSVPWWTPQAATLDLEARLAECLEASRDRVTGLLREIAHPTVMRRLARQFSPSLVRKIVGLLTPPGHGDLEGEMADWATLLHRPPEAPPLTVPACTFPDRQSATHFVREQALVGLTRQGPPGTVSRPVSDQIVKELSSRAAPREAGVLRDLARRARRVLPEESSVRRSVEELLPSPGGESGTRAVSDEPREARLGPPRSEAARQADHPDLGSALPDERTPQGGLRTPLKDEKAARSRRKKGPTLAGGAETSDRAARVTGQKVSIPRSVSHPGVETRASPSRPRREVPANTPARPDPSAAPGLGSSRPWPAEQPVPPTGKGDTRGGRGDLPAAAGVDPGTIGLAHHEKTGSGQPGSPSETTDQQTLSAGPRRSPREEEPPRRERGAQTSAALEEAHLPERPAPTAARDRGTDPGVGETETTTRRDRHEDVSPGSLESTEETPSLERHRDEQERVYSLEIHELPDLEEGRYVDNAGLVLLWPYLTGYFQKLELVGPDKTFRSEATQERAVMLLQLLATGTSENPEHLLLLNKLLCGWPLLEPITRAFEATEDERRESQELLASVIANWKALKNTSVEGLRTSFLQREGRLRRQDSGWQLKVARLGYDVLLDQLPWGIGLALLPWMKEPLSVEW